MVDSFLNEKTYALIDELEAIAKAHQTNVASVALAWVHAQSGVSSVIIGARRLSQLDDNVRAVDVNLTADELARLDALTTAEVRIPAQHAGNGPGHSQRRDDGQRCLGADVGVRDARKAFSRTEIGGSHSPECIFSAPSTLAFLSSPAPFAAAFFRFATTLSTAPLSAEPSGKPR